ncbi:MAG: YkgJ family cysteine cluster protein [Planctomycetes bacterium]|nr:YkgJ family cysteine cluster protein [Planctomycetota bacterium]
MPDLDCERCGACCRAQPPFGGGVFVRLGPADLARLLPAEAARLVVAAPDGRRALPLAHAPGGHQVCAALRGRIGAAVACEVYPRRPDACRGLERGSDACRLAREEAGLA